MEVLAALIGSPAPTPAKSGLTGHFKAPVQIAEITKEGLIGDHIIDRKHHGGPDQAVYIFGDVDRRWWADHLARDVPAGFFGENLLISDLESADLCVGDTFHIGTVKLQVTAPRIPCATYAAHIGTPQAIKQFYAVERPGAYARVLSEGLIATGTAVRLQRYDGPRLTMRENMAGFLDQYSDLKLLQRALQVPAHHKLHELARERLHEA